MMFLLLRVPLSSALLAAVVALAASSPSQPPAHVTWSKDIAPIVYYSCVGCHHPGGPAPFSLLSDADARKRARQIAQVTASHFMPPWLPEPNSGPFAHSRRLPASQIALLQRWATEGASAGPLAEAPVPPHFASGWQLGTPDRIVAMPHPYMLPPETTSPYRCFVLPLALPGAKWLRAVEIRPGNLRVVRQAVVYADPTGTARRLEQQSGAVGYTAPAAGLDPNAEPLAEWDVGSVPWALPNGSAERLPAGADLVLLVRFEPDGQPETVRPEIGLFYAPRLPHSTPQTLTLGSRDLILDPGQTAIVTDTFTLPVAARLLRVTPHAHPVCRTLQVTALLPTGAAQNVLQINDWNADWQDAYQLSDPPTYPVGTRLTVRWTVDNSRKNPRNPSASPMTVMPGLLFPDEMATVRLQLLAAAPADALRLQKTITAPRPAPVIHTTHSDRHG